MATLKMTCSCGAKMSIEGTSSDCDFRSREFLEAHYICRKHGVRKQWEIEDENSNT
jgi:hypothetical protein